MSNARHIRRLAPLRIGRSTLSGMALLISTLGASAQHLVDLGALPGSSFCHPRGLSADGTIASGYSYPGNSISRMFRWTAAGGLQDMGGLTPSISSDSRALSSDGSASAGGGVVNGAWHALRWSAASGWQDLGTLPGRNASIARGISGDGATVAGESWHPVHQRAFRWTAALGMQELGTQSLGMVNLNVYLPSRGVDLTGWYLLDVRAISADGSVVLGTGVVNFLGRAWLVVLPPECYANCDRSTSPPALNVNDFVCFQSRFAAGDSYADCDHSGVVNVNDFVCFQGRFAAGCR